MKSVYITTFPFTCTEGLGGEGHSSCLVQKLAVLFDSQVGSKTGLNLEGPSCVVFGLDGSEYLFESGSRFRPICSDVG